MNRNKGAALIVIIVTFLGILILGGAIYIIQQKFLVREEIASIPVAKPSGSSSSEPISVETIEISILKEDTLWDFAQKFSNSGLGWEDIYELNKAELEQEAKKRGLKSALTYDNGRPTIWIFPSQKVIIKQDPLSIICNKIYNQVTKNNCYWAIAEIKQNFSICDKSQGRDYCYRLVAAKKQDLSMCDKIQDQLWEDICYQDIAKTKQDISICDKILDQERRYYCFRFVAVARQDLSICDKILNEGLMKGNCYREVAMAGKESLYKDRDSKKDLSICDKIQDQDGKDYCYQEVASEKNDVSICDEIDNQEIRDICYLGVVRNWK